MSNLRALIISKDLKDELQKEKIITTRIHSIFSSACNLEYNDKLITLLKKEKTSTPMSIVLDSKIDFNFNKLLVKKDKKLLITNENIYFEREKISLKDIGVYNPYIVFPNSYVMDTIFQNNLMVFENTLLKYGKLNFFKKIIIDINNKFRFFSDECLQLGKYSEETIEDTICYEFIRSRFLSFLDVVVKCDIKNIDRYAEKIIGFGVGLTPSIDDFISGLMISFIYLADYYSLDIIKIYKFNNKLIEKSINKTTKVSYEMLTHSANGAINEGVKLLMNTLLSQDKGVYIEESLKKVISFGETSGSDTALGAYVGLKLLTDIRYRRNFK